MKRPAAVAIGMFDGVHIGHRYMLGSLVRYAAQHGIESAAVTFDRHPLAVIRPDTAPTLLCGIEKRVELIGDCGVDDVRVVSFDDTVRRMDAETFVRNILLPKINVKTVFLGYDNGFGSDRLRGAEAYARILAPLGIDVVQCQPYPGMTVSSSLVRRAVHDGDVATAAQMLGRNYSLAGTVVHGKALGRKLGFPTANLSVDLSQSIPLSGVYAGRVTDPQNGLFGQSAVINVGTAPTVNGDVATNRTIEAYVLDTSADMYDHRVEVEFVRRLRDEQRFADLDALRDAITRDAASARDVSGV